MKNTRKYIIIIILLIILLVLSELYVPIERHILTKIYYNKASKLCKKKNKKLLVIGDPCTGNINMWMQKMYPNCKHGNVTIDLYGCDKCDKMDINNMKKWKKYKSNKYIVIETGTLSFGKDIEKILSQIKRISGGDFFSSGGTRSFGWKYVGSKIYSKKYPEQLEKMIYPFNSLKDEYYIYYDLKTKKTIKINWKNL